MSHKIMKTEMHIKASRLSSWFSYIVMGILCTVGSVFVVGSAFEFVLFSDPDERTLLLAFSIVWTAAALWMSYVALKMPTTIDVNESGIITLQSPLRTISLKPNEINKLIYCDGDLSLQYTKERLNLRHFTNKRLEQFLSWVVLENPNVQTPDELRIR